MLLGVLALTWQGTATSADELTFEQHIRPLLKARCFSCHGEDTELAGNLDVRLVKHLRSGGDSGPAIVVGQRSESPLYQRMLSGEMPPDGAQGLTTEQLELVGRWIDAGALTRRPEAVASSSGITPEDRAFWSFQPLATPQIPATQTTGWARNPIDMFVLAVLEARGLQPSVPADDRTFARRLSLVTRGLMPSVAEVTTFTQEAAPDKHERLIAKSLADPAYGERWGRVWLDLARYSDKVPAYLYNAERAWLYRDWIIRSFNEDRPYTDFVKRQLAADLIPDLPPAEKAALGFLGLSPVYWKELQLAPDVIETIVADEWDERVDAITRTFLGLTVSCARCHNHKFDPVTVEDYHALAGVVASTRMIDQPLIPAEQAAEVARARNQVAGWQATLNSLKTDSSALTPIFQAQIVRLQEATPAYHQPWAHGVDDASLFVLPDGPHRTKLEYRPGMPQDLPVFRRGNPSDRGAIVARRFLEVLSPGTPEPFRQGSGRRELAESLFDEAEALTARVLVNRLWTQVFGRGLVSTPSDFGRQGERPTHPELLDYLAVRLIEHHWQWKPVLQEILESATFRASSLGTPESMKLDPDGRWLSRYSRRRMEVEQWRDTILQAVGQLDDRMYGEPGELQRTPFVRRTIYGRVVREELDTMLRLYDFPEASGHSPGREPTSTPLQQLFVLNGDLFQHWSAQWELASRHLPDDRARIVWAYQQLLQREPTPRELERGLQFLADGPADPTQKHRRSKAYFQVLLSLNEALFLD